MLGRGFPFSGEIPTRTEVMDPVLPGMKWQSLLVSTYTFAIFTGEIRPQSESSRSCLVLISGAYLFREDTLVKGWAAEQVHELLAGAAPKPSFLGNFLFKYLSGG